MEAGDESGEQSFSVASVKGLRLPPKGLFCLVLLSYQKKQILPPVLRISEDMPPSPMVTEIRRGNSGFSWQPSNVPLFTEVIESVSPLSCSTRSVPGCKGSPTMPLEVPCRCALCQIEAELLCELARADASTVREEFSAFPALLRHSSASSLLLHLRTSPANAESDDLFRELF